MKKTTENPRKTNYFVSIVAPDNNGKISYENIVYTSKNPEDCFRFATENYTRSVTTAVKKYKDLVALGISEKKLLEFKNPVLY